MKDLTTLLVIEDDYVMLTLIQKMLLQAGYKVIPMQNGADAKHRIEQGGYNLVVTDLFMPYASGFSLIETLRTHLRTRDIPVVVVTSFANTDTLSALTDFNVSAVLQKPFTMQQLIDAVEQGLLCAKEAAAV